MQFWMTLLSTSIAAANTTSSLKPGILALSDPLSLESWGEDRVVNILALIFNAWVAQNPLHDFSTTCEWGSR